VIISTPNKEAVNEINAIVQCSYNGHFCPHFNRYTDSQHAFTRADCQSSHERTNRAELGKPNVLSQSSNAHLRARELGSLLWELQFSPASRSFARRKVWGRKALVPDSNNSTHHLNTERNPLLDWADRSQRHRLSIHSSWVLCRQERWPDSPHLRPDLRHVYDQRDRRGHPKRQYFSIRTPNGRCLWLRLWVSPKEEAQTQRVRNLPVFCQAETGVFLLKKRAKALLYIMVPGKGLEPSRAKPTCS
jgi:hypothetical protein